MISLKIDVTKIDKSKLFNGKQGTYLDAILIETPNNQYGDDYMIVQSVSKEEREQGIKGAILGNARKFGQSIPQSNDDQLRDSMDYADKDDLPF